MYKVLIVDDNSKIRFLLTKMIEKKFECEIIEAENGLIAINKISAEDPDVVFLDISMPHLGGLETLATVRKEQKFKNLPIVMITAINDRKTVKEAIDFGVEYYLLKPIIFDQVLPVLIKIFQKVDAYKK